MDSEWGKESIANIGSPSSGSLAGFFGSVETSLYPGKTLVASQGDDTQEMWNCGHHDDIEMSPLGWPRDAGLDIESVQS